jgi:hypothetical protein
MARFANGFLKFLGILLLTAAALKLHGWAVDPVRPTGWFAIPAVQFTIVLVEAALGVWFLTGWANSAAWLAAFSLFSLFSVVSFRQGWIGEASCGCFGSLAVNPWLAFGIDVAALALLAITRPSRDDFSALRLTLTTGVMRTAFAVVLIAGAGLGVLTWRHGSLDAAFASLRGDSLTLSPPLVDLGSGPANASRVAEVELFNHTAEPVLIYGGTSDCSCTVAGNLPLRIAPSESQKLQVQVRLPREPGRFTRQAKLMTDAPAARIVTFQITGQSIEANPEVAEVR